ncbi:MAG: EutN/CcmL family microcompartment protein [Syntrophobacteraceae bacterium]
MELGKVKGQVVSTARNPGLPHLTLLLVDIVNAEGTVQCADQIAADVLGAGEGELVLLARGSSARLIIGTPAPIDLSVIGIVDQVTSNEKAFYTK